MVFPLAGADAHDHYFFTERDSLADSPAIRIAGAAALDAAGLGIDDVARFDLYSCFPAAVEIAMQAYGLERAGRRRRPPAHAHRRSRVRGRARATTTRRTRSRWRSTRAAPIPGSVGLVTALGWYATKHSVGLYSTTPPDSGLRRGRPGETQRAVDALPSREPAGEVDGEVTVEATSVTFDRDGSPSVAIISALTSDGRRALANTHDVEAMPSMCAEPWEGTTVRLVGHGGSNSLAV